MKQITNHCKVTAYYIMMLSCIVCVDAVNGIGLKNRVPWHLPEDILHFKKITMGHFVLMGRSTMQSIPKKYFPLSGRHNIVISRTLPTPKPEAGYTVVRNLEEALCSVQKNSELTPDTKIFCIGGGQLYRQVLEHRECQEIVLTRIHQKFECDTIFPQLDPREFELIEQSCLNNNGTYRYTFEQYRRCGFITDEHQYLDLIKEIIRDGVVRSDRTGTGTKSLFGKQFRYDLRNNKMPLFTTKKVFWKGIVEELLWFLRGSTDTKELDKKKVRIWNPNSTKEFLKNRNLPYREGDIGPGYGFQWRHAGAKYNGCDDDYIGMGIDQISEVIRMIRQTPNSRRIIVSAWNVIDLDKMALPPCHAFIQFYVSEGRLSCLMYQRSADMGLGVPFNVASYALLCRIIAHYTDTVAHEFIHTIGDAHIYLNHIKALQSVIKREPHESPTLTMIDLPTNFEDLTYDNFQLHNYLHHSPVRMKMAV